MRFFLFSGVLMGLSLLVFPAAAQVTQASLTSDVRSQVRRLSPEQQEDILWLARCVYSESNLDHEQRLVAWVVRNRVETGYRGNTYRDVVLEPYQFSAFNHNSARRRQLLGLNLDTASRAWRQALQAAYDVYFQPSSRRPFPTTTRHFYSPISMEGGRTPGWALNQTPLSSAGLGVDPYRFKFYTDIDEGFEGTTAGVSAAERTEQRVSEGWTYVKPRLRSSRLGSQRLGRSTFSGRVKRPVRPHLDRRTRK